MRHLITALLAALFSLGFQACSKATQSQSTTPGASRQPVEVMQIARRDMVESLSLVGSLAPNETAQIRAEISGQVRAVLFSEGELVHKDQVLLRVDDAELRTQLAQAEARFHLAELNLQRSENLAEARSLSRAEADRTRSEYAATEAELQYLKVRLAKTEIKAPFDGVVGARSISPGDYVTAATVITTLDDLSRLKVEFQVPERYINRVQPGAVFTVRAKTPEGEVKAEGSTYFISSVIDRSTRSSQVKGYITMAQPALKPGMFANVDLVLEVHRNVFSVPEAAILSMAKGASLIVVRGVAGQETAEMVPVSVGLRSRGYVEVRSEPGQLTDDTVVVASGVGGLSIFPGTKLDPRPLKQEFRSGE
jgi:membrane fusion protein, multidrug efflux system